MIVRIGAEDAGLSKALSNIGVQGKNLDDQLSKLGNKPLGVEAERSALKLSETLTAVRAGTAGIAQTADSAAAGINRLGGVTALTSRQLDVMARTVRDGLDAYRALGQEAPAELQKVSEAIRKQQAELKALNATPKPTAAPQVSSGLSGALGGLLPFSGIETAGIATGAAVAGLTREALALADSLTKISDRTGIDVIALQRLSAIAEPSGNTLEDVANAVNKFQKNIAGGDKEAVGAITRLGLSLAELRRQSGDEQFIAIAKAIQKIQDPAEQTLIAMQLFGRSGAELLPTLKSKVDELADSTVKMSAESVKALDDFGDALHTLRVNAVNEAGTILANFISFVKGLKDALPKAQNVDNPPELLRQQPRFGSAKTGAPQPSTAVLPPLAGAQLFPPGSLQGGAVPASPGLVSGQAAQQAAAIALVTAELHRQEAVADLLGLSLDEYRNKLKDVAKKSAELAAGSSGLSFSQKQQILINQQLGLSVEEISIKLGISKVAVSAYLDEFKGLVDGMRNNTEATGKFQQELGKTIVGFDAAGKAVVGFTGVLKAVPFGLDSIQTGVKLLNADLIALIRSGDLTAETLARIGSVQTSLPGQSSPATDIIRAQETATQSARRILAQIRKDELEGADVTVKWKDELSGLSAAFSHLAQVTDGAFGGIVRDIAGVISGLDVVNKGLHQFQDSKEHVDASGNTVHASAVGQITGLASAGAGFLSVTGSGSTASRAIGGAAAGGQIGLALAGPVGEGIGAAVGFVTGILRGLHQSEAQRLAHDVGRDLGVQISDGLAQQLEADSQKIGRQATESLHLDQIIGEAAGGVKGFGVELAISKARDLFSFLATGRLTAQQVGDEFDKVFSLILPEAIDQTTRLASTSFTELVQQARNAGQLTPSVKAFTGQQVNDNILTGLTDFLKVGNDAADAQRKLISLQRQLASAQESGNTKRIAQIQKEIAATEQQQHLVKAALVSSQDSATALGGALFVAFQQLRENGANITDALKQIQPSFDALEKSLKKSGFSGGEAFNALKPFFALIKDPVVGPAIDAVDALSKVLAGLNNIGRPDATIISGIGNQIGSIIGNLTAGGKSQDDIERILAPSLQQLFELQERTGAQFDNVTQAILDKALKDGLIGDQFKSAQEREVTATLRTNFLLERIGDKLGAVFLPTPKPPPAAPRPSPEPGDTNPLPIAGGGFVGASGFGVSRTQPFGSKVLVFPKSIGVDTVPAMLQQSEFVLNVPQQLELRKAVATGFTSDPVVSQLLAGSLAHSSFPTLGHGTFPSIGRVSRFADGGPVGRVLPFMAGRQIDAVVPQNAPTPVEGSSSRSGTTVVFGDVHTSNKREFEDSIPALAEKIREHVGRGGTPQTKWRNTVKRTA